MSTTVAVTSATLDKNPAGYAAGDVMTLTVVRAASSTSERVDTLDVGASAADGTQAAKLTITATIEITTPEASTVAFTDSSGRAWTAGRDDGMTAVFTAVA